MLAEEFKFCKDLSIQIDQGGFIFKTIFCVFLFSVSAAANLGPNDISILLPLPLNKDFSQLLSPKDMGSMGPLISLQTFSELPQLFPEQGNEISYENSMRAIALRVDPCFKDTFDPAIRCRHQIRIVWQPLYPIADELIARDAAVHTFYELSDSDWNSFLVKWKSFATQKSEPLQIHPEILQQGLKGPLWKNMKQQILRFCGEKNLTRITAMTVRVFSEMWDFVGFDIQANGLMPITIARVNQRQQEIHLSDRFRDEFFGGIFPTPRNQDTVFFRLIANSTKAAETFSEQDFQDIQKSIRNFENPKLHRPGTLDCVSCHIAQTAASWMEQKLGRSMDENSSLLLRPKLSSNQLRSFGYFEKDAVISQRVRNETAEVLKTLGN